MSKPRIYALPAIERVKILSGRVENLRGGAGQYANELARDKAIMHAESALRAAQLDLIAEHELAKIPAAQLAKLMARK